MNPMALTRTLVLHGREYGAAIMTRCSSRAGSSRARDVVAAQQADRRARLHETTPKSRSAQSPWPMSQRPNRARHFGTGGASPGPQSFGSCRLGRAGSKRSRSSRPPSREQAGRSGRRPAPGQPQGRPSTTANLKRVKEKHRMGRRIVVLNRRVVHHQCELRTDWTDACSRRWSSVGRRQRDVRSVLNVEGDIMQAAEAPTAGSS